MSTALLSYSQLSRLNPSSPCSLKPLSRTLLVKAETEIRVCVNRTCNRSGSREILQVLSDLAPANLTVKSCGCLGRCGAGPNIAVLPDGYIVGHCGTAVRAAELLGDVCGGPGGGGFDSFKSLEALGLRKKGEGEKERGNFSEAEALFSEAIELKPSGGLHAIYKCRSAARLLNGNYAGALEDSEEALKRVPKYPEAYICQGDALLAMDEYDAAERAYASALQIDPSIRRSKSFKARVAQLQEKLTTANVAS
ncbi:hypothetical protein H6P81_018153 [Aristolochia fimbriata]|uniref:Uncharacterized protein n=1 Tax=Aristolochia fimbriata TaxID=158543 RepID=A0AAV7E232_ARIFI|nr:hypothetical protein H6P81_018153 [Aristolochia fimbriata]